MTKKKIKEILFFLVLSWVGAATYKPVVRITVATTKAIVAEVKNMWSDILK